MLATAVFSLMLATGQVQPQVYETGSRWELPPGQLMYAAVSEDEAVTLNRWAAADPVVRIDREHKDGARIIEGVELIHGQARSSLIRCAWITFKLQSTSAQEIDVIGRSENDPAAVRGAIESACLSEGRHPLFGYKGRSLWIPHFYNARPYALIGEECYAYARTGTKTMSAAGAFDLTELEIAMKAEDSGDDRMLALLKRGGRLIGSAGNSRGLVVEGTTSASRVLFTDGTLKGKKLWFAKLMCQTLPPSSRR